MWEKGLYRDESSSEGVCICTGGDGLQKPENHQFHPPSACRVTHIPCQLEEKQLPKSSEMGFSSSSPSRGGEISIAFEPDKQVLNDVTVISEI